MWEDLSLKEKAEMMRIGILNGISDLNHIKEAYNEYSRGGYALWKKKIYKHKGINVDADNTYDYKGFYNAHPNEAWEMLKEDPEYHFDDEYKTAYHPTFSTYSKYSGVKHPQFNPKGWEGGTWSNDDHLFTVSKDLYDNNRNDNLDRIIRYLEEETDNGVVIKKWDGSYPMFEDGSYYGGVLPTITTVAPYNRKGKKKALGGNLFEDGGEEDVYADIYMDPPIDEPGTWPYMLYLNGVVITPSELDIEDMKIWNEAFPEGRPQELLKEYARGVSEGKDPSFFYHNLAKLIKASGSLNIKDWESLSDKVKEKLGRNKEGIGRAFRSGNDLYIDYNNPNITPDKFMNDYYAEEGHLFNDTSFPNYYLFEGIRPDPNSGQWDSVRNRYVNQDYNTPGGNEFNTHSVIVPKTKEWLENENSGELSELVDDIQNNYVKYATDAVRELQKKERKAGTGKYILEGFDVNRIQTVLDNIRKAINKKGREYNTLVGDTEKGKKALEEEYRKEMKEELELRENDKSGKKWWYNGDPNVPSRYTGRKVGMYGYGGQVNKFPLGGGLLPWFTSDLFTEDNTRKLASGTSAVGSAIAMVPTPITRGVGAALTIPATMFDIYDTYLDIKNGANTSDYVVDGLNLAIDALPVLPLKLPKGVKFSLASRLANKLARGAIAEAIEPTVLTAVPNLTLDLYNLFGPNYVDYVDNEGRPFKYSNDWDRYSVLLPDVVVKGKRRKRKK